MKMVRAVRTGGKGARTDNAEGLHTYRIKRATTSHRTGKLEDGGCAVQIEVLSPARFVFCSRLIRSGSVMVHHFTFMSRTGL
ncbi:MAG: hypothetical protein P4L69_22155 [Desulfosporosinus sp.]|nr:hypothetical protein [Desulfosporosinus sp.]